MSETLFCGGVTVVVADVARFLAEVVPARWNVTRTVTFGGSYSGALSAWARVRLPARPVSGSGGERAA